MSRADQLERDRKRWAAQRETLANPFRRKRSANCRARYLNPREALEHPSLYDRDGNRTGIRFDFQKDGEA